MDGFHIVPQREVDEQGRLKFEYEPSVTPAHIVSVVFEHERDLPAARAALDAWLAEHIEAIPVSKPSAVLIEDEHANPPEYWELAIAVQGVD